MCFKGHYQQSKKGNPQKTRKCLQTTDTRLISRIHKEPLQFNKKTSNNPVQKRSKDSNRPFSKEDTHTANRLTRCSTSLIIREHRSTAQRDTTSHPGLPPKNRNQCWRGYGEPGTQVHHCCGRQYGGSSKSRHRITV